MNRKTYNKLIRDKIPAIIKSKGGIPKVSVLTEADYRKALKVKIGEEAKELLDAETNDELINELVDIQELIRAILANYGLSMNELEKNRRIKLQERGGFKERLWLEYVDEH
jgi:predicted house-cleaning noncanonical NTP pyrophosphatase (MazG superfamily)